MCEAPVFSKRFCLDGQNICVNKSVLSPVGIVFVNYVLFLLSTQHVGKYVFYVYIEAFLLDILVSGSFVFNFYAYPKLPILIHLIG